MGARGWGLRLAAGWNVLELIVGTISFVDRNVVINSSAERAELAFYRCPSHQFRATQVKIR